MRCFSSLLPRSFGSIGWITHERIGMHAAEKNKLETHSQLGVTLFFPSRQEKNKESFSFDHFDRNPPTNAQQPPYQ